jgi:PAS domain S-box-containing protein
MTTLARWLSDHRPSILPRWLAAAAGTPHGANGHSNGVAIHPDERVVVLVAIYDGLISAAGGDPAPLDECLRLARAIRATPGEDELADQIATAQALRRAAIEHLLQEAADLATVHELLPELNALFDRLVETLTGYWTASAAAVLARLRESELLAESLHAATEQADHIALQLSSLNEIGQALAASLDRARLFDVIGGRLHAALNIEQVLLCLPQDGGALAVARSWGAQTLAADALLVGGEGDLVQRAYRSGEIVFEAAPNPAVQSRWYQPGRAVLVVPLRAQDHPVGVLVLQDPAAARLADERAFVNSVASQAAIALENARLYEEVRGFNAVLEARIAERTRELQSERDMLETIHQIGLEVSSTLDLDTLLQNCLDMLARLIGVQHGSIMLLERETDHLVDRAVLGEPRARGYTRFPLGVGVVGWAAQHKKPALVGDVARDPRWAPPRDGSEHDHKTSGAMIVVPLVAHNDVMGALVLSHAETDYFTEAHLRLLTAASGEIALGIYNALLYDQIQQELMRQGERLRNERRAAAQSYAILQSLTDGVIVCNAEGSVMAANPAASRILDIAVEDLLTWHMPELFGRILGPRAAEAPVEDLLNRPHNPQGRPRYFQASFRIQTREVSLSLGPVTASNDEVLGAVAVFRDITREVEADRLKDEFIGTVSHELRTPMTSIKGFTQLLAMGSLGPLTDSQKEFINTIAANTERMISIINDLLDITKIETGSVLSELDIRPVALPDALSNVVGELQPRMAARGQELTLTLAPGLPRVRADARRFNQILANLISNAVKYTPRGGKIAVEAREAALEDVPGDLREGLRPGRYVLIEVRDTGIGIPLEDQERIWERFTRLQSPLTIEAGGTGLGLALVRPLVRLFGGRIWLESAPDEGSTFSFVMPVAAP